MGLNLVWLYFDLMNTYGDRGNMLVLGYRLRQRKIPYRIIEFTVNSPSSLLKQADFLFMGGAEDRQQRIVAKDLVKAKVDILREKIIQGIPGLFICGAYQFLGKYYETAEAERLKCLGIAPIHTENPGPRSPRLIGDVVAKLTHPSLLETSYFHEQESRYLIGFENHGGRTYLEDEKQSLGPVVKGFGNNEHSRQEGMFFQNVIGTYLHGPILPRNPALTDFLIAKALSIKYNQEVELEPLDDELELANRRYLLQQFHV